MVQIYENCDQILDFCHRQLLRKMQQKISWTDGRTDRGKTVYPPPPSGSGGIIKLENRNQESDGSKNTSHNIAYQYEDCDEISDFCHQQLLRKMRRKMSIYVQCVEKSSRQTGNRNLKGPKTLPTIWGTYMKLVTKYQISAINSC